MSDEWAKKPRITVSPDLKEQLDSWKRPSETYESALEGLLERAGRDRGNLPRN